MKSQQLAKPLLIAILFVPLLLIVPLFPVSFLWLSGYAITMLLIISRKWDYLFKGGAIIYIGAAIAVLGRHYMLGPLSGRLSPQEDTLVIETFFQVIIMASSGLGGGLLAHYVITEDQEKNKKKKVIK